MFAQLQRQGRLEIVFSRRQPNRRREGRLGNDLPRPQRFSITVRKEPGAVLGIQVTVGRHGVTVTSVNEGIIREWNERNARHQVRPGDRIVFVNGVRREDMVFELAKEGTLYIVLQRGYSKANGRNTMPPSLVENLPCFEYCEGLNKFKKYEACGICLEDWAPGSQAMELPCKHLFHPDCASPWLTKHSALCPLCGWAADHDKGKSFDPDTDLDCVEEEEEGIAAAAQSLPNSQISNASGPYGSGGDLDTPGLDEVTAVWRGLHRCGIAWIF